MWIANTNVSSELQRPVPRPAVTRWFAETPIEHVYTTTVNLAEICFGISSPQDRTRAAIIENWFERSVRPMFDGRVLPVDEAALTTWRQFARRAQKPAFPLRPRTSSSPQSRASTVAPSSRATLRRSPRLASRSIIRGRTSASTSRPGCDRRAALSRKSRGDAVWRFAPRPRLMLEAAHGDC